MKAYLMGYIHNIKPISKIDFTIILKRCLSYYSLYTCITTHVRISEPLVELGQAHEFSQLLEEDLDKYPTGRVGLFLVEVDAGHTCPREGVGVKQLTKELGNVAKFVGLQAMNCTILCGKEENKYNIIVNLKTVSTVATM